MNKRYFRRYWRTIGIFTVWLFLVAYVFGAAKEALNSLNILISLIVLIGMEYGLSLIHISCSLLEEQLGDSSDGLNRLKQLAAADRQAEG